MICRHCNTRSAFYTGKFHRKKHPIVGGNKVRWVKGRKRPEINCKNCERGWVQTQYDIDLNNSIKIF